MGGDARHRDAAPVGPWSEASGPARGDASLGRMKEYQAVIVRFGKRVRDDEDALTDLLNERSRAGWTPALMTQDGTRLTVLFAREAPNVES